MQLLLGALVGFAQVLVGVCIVVRPRDAHLDGIGPLDARQVGRGVDAQGLPAAVH